MLALESSPPYEKLDYARVEVTWSSKFWQENTKVKADKGPGVQIIMVDRESMCALASDVRSH